MKATVKIEKEVDIKTLVVNAKVRYWEDTEVNGVADNEEGGLIPCRVGEMWKLEIDVETGKITNWKQGTTADVHYKVCDAGDYSLVDESGETVISFEGYVPKCMCPKDKGYGDYIIMDINSDGFIQDWKFTEEDVEYFADHQDN